MSSRAASAGFDLSAGFASNGYGALSPGKYSMGAAIVTEVVMTFMFLIVILGVTHERAPVGFAGLAIGLALTLIHLISIPVTNTSVNPARSTRPALFAGMAYIQQLWLFWLAPLAGAALGGFVYRDRCSIAIPSRKSWADRSRQEQGRRCAMACHST